jgi:hypothetical protein
MFCPYTRQVALLRSAPVLPSAHADIHPPGCPTLHLFCEINGTDGVESVERGGFGHGEEEVQVEAPVLVGVHGFG